MNLDEIITRAIPLTFHGVKCPAILNKEKQKAELRRIQLKKEILTLLENQKMPGFEIAINLEWTHEESDHSNCYECKEIIFGTMHCCNIFVGSTLAGTAKICDECVNKADVGVQSNGFDPIA